MYRNAVVDADLDVLAHERLEARHFRAQAVFAG
jgi:hypothetical protein